MKKLLTVIISLFLILSLCSCSGKNDDSAPKQPPAFSVLQKQAKLKKYSETGESASFSKEDFGNFFGEEVSRITVTSLPTPEDGTLIFNGMAVMQGQTLPAEQLKFLKFIPSAECKSTAFNFNCDENGYGEKEFCCEITFGDGVNTSPVAQDSLLKTVEGISCRGNLEISEPNGDSFTINVITYPTKGFISVSQNGEVVYTPEKGFYGKDSMIYNVTDGYGNSSANATLSIQVDENVSGLEFADMQENSNHLYAHRMCANNTMVYRKTDGEYYFDPDTPVSKADFLVMMMCITNLDENVNAVADSAINDDNGLTSGMKGYLSAAAEKGLLRLDNGNFSPKSDITLDEAAYMITKALDLPWAESENAATQEGMNNYKEIISAVKAGIIHDADGGIDVNSVITKAEAAKLLCNVEDYMLENNMFK